jgi:carbamoyl-phosphate synthase large subunit
MDELFQLTRIDPWFLVQIEDLIREEQALRRVTWYSA